MYLQNPYIFEFLREDWRKFLSCTQNIWRITLKNINMLLKT